MDLALQCIFGGIRVVMKQLNSKDALPLCNILLQSFLLHLAMTRKSSHGFGVQLRWTECLTDLVFMETGLNHSVYQKQASEAAICMIDQINSLITSRQELLQEQMELLG
jgi:hypothetical protein